MSDGLFDALTPDERGLVVAVVQDATTDQVLMVGYMNEEAFRLTASTGSVTFWSRSRQQLWKKGETSGNVLRLVELRVDCDGDALLVRAHPAGPTCHTGKPSCFFRPLADDRLAEDDGPPAGSDAVYERVFAVIEDRKAGRGATGQQGRSYVRSLLEKGTEAISSKIREEADELCRALAEETPDRVANEAADLWFHAMVGLAHRAVHVRDVARVLMGRFGRSGIDEKESRSSGA